MKPFHVFLHARPVGSWPRESSATDGRMVTRTVVPPDTLSDPLPVSFEDAADAMGALPRMFLEPDGSFVWVGESADVSRWQIDGMLWDRGGRLQTVELKGECPSTAFEELLRAWGLDPTALLVQLVGAAVFLDVEEFQREWLQ